MSHKKLAILGIVAAGMVLWAVAQSNISHRPVELGFTSGATLLQGFDPAVVGSIVVQSAGKTVTLVRQDGGFVVVEKGRYPAKTKQINYLITSCLDIQTTDLITSDRANFADLGVSDDKPLKSVRFFNPDQSLIAGILVGNAAKDTQGAYVRLVGGDKAYLSANVPPVQTEPMDYIETMLAEVKRENIVKVSAEGPQGSYVVMNNPNGGLDLANIPAGKQAKAEAVAQAFAVLTNLSIIDVVKDTGKIKFDRTYVGELRDSSVYTLHVASQGSKHYVKCSAEFRDQSGVFKKYEVESQEELKAKEAKLLARDRAEEFTKRTRGWMYELSEWNAKALTSDFTDLIENEPKKKPGAEPYDPNKTMPYDPKKKYE